MKKSKVIIPAMALLLFSTAASITGTVAWFTSSRTFNMSAGEFTINNVEGGMDVTVTPRVGTKLVDGTKNIATKDNVNFTHGSVNHAALNEGGTAYDPVAWTLNKESTGAGNYYSSKGVETAAFAYTTDDANPWRGVLFDTKSYYVAVSWQISFTYEFNSETADVGLFFNVGDSTITANATPQRESKTGYNSYKTQYGFRIAFIPQTGKTGAKVWGNRTEAEGTVSEFSASETYSADKLVAYQGKVYKCTTAITEAAPWDATKWEEQAGVATINQGLSSDLHYVNDESSTTAAPKYTTDDFLPEKAGGDAGDYVAAVDGKASNKTRPDRLGTFKKADGESSTINILCVAWFEGEDPNVISEAQMDKVTADLSFYARTDGDAA